MAKGDMVSTSVAIAATSTALYIPSGTIEVMIRMILGDNGDMHYTYGSAADSGLIGVGTQANGPKNVKCFINNSFPLRMSNVGASSQEFGFTGVQTK